MALVSEATRQVALGTGASEHPGQASEQDKVQGLQRAKGEGWTLTGPHSYKGPSDFEERARKADAMKRELGVVCGWEGGGSGISLLWLFKWEHVTLLSGIL